MWSRSSSESSDLQTTTGICPALLPGCMLDIFAAANCHQYAKGAQLYCQLMKELETLPAYKDSFKSFTTHGNHVVHSSSHEWSGTWCDICTEQTLMKAAKSEGGLSRGRMRNRDSSNKCWVLTLSHFSDVKQRMEQDIGKYAMLHTIQRPCQNTDEGSWTCSRMVWRKQAIRQRSRQRVPSVFLNRIHKHMKWLSQWWQRSWSRDGDADQAGWTVSDIDHVYQVKGTSTVITQKDSHGQGEENSPWLTEVVQPTDHFRQLTQADSMIWLPSHCLCSATKIRRWTRKTWQTFQRQAWRR